MAHLHSIYDTDSHFSIDPITRAIKNESPKKVTVMQYDHNSERFTFEVPRYVEGHDMSICNRVEVHYQNGETKGVYEVKDLQLFPEDENIVICSWLISQNCTKFAAALDFRLTYKCIADDGETLDYVWSTAMHKGISVSAGISNSDDVIEQYADVLEQWEKTLFENMVPGCMVVTLNYVADGTIANHSASEIIAHLKSGGSVFLADGNNIATLFSIYENDVSFLRCDKFGERTTYAILEDKTCQKITMGQETVSEEAMNSAISAKVDSSFIPVSQEEYDAMVAAGTIDESKYYMIVG